MLWNEWEVTVTATETAMNVSFDQGRDLQCHRRPQRRRCCRQHSGSRRIRTGERERSAGQWVGLHPFIHSWRAEKYVWHPPACSKGQKSWKALRKWGDHGGQTSYIVNAKCLIKVEDYNVIFKDIDAFQLNWTAFDTVSGSPRITEGENGQIERVAGSFMLSLQERKVLAKVEKRAQEVWKLGNKRPYQCCNVISSNIDDIAVLVLEEINIHCDLACFPHSIHIELWIDFSYLALHPRCYCVGNNERPPKFELLAVQNLSLYTQFRVTFGDERRSYVCNCLNN